MESPAAPNQQQPSYPYPVNASVSAVPSSCPSCHIQIRPTDYFCFNCGKNLRPKPLSTSVTTQAMYYIGSILLPPMGIIWGVRYLRDANPKAKIVGLVCVIITILIIVVAVVATVRFINIVTMQVNDQMQNIMQF